MRLCPNWVQSHFNRRFTTGVTGGKGRERLGFGSFQKKVEKYLEDQRNGCIFAANTKGEGLG